MLEYIYGCITRLIRGLQAAQERRAAFWQLQNLTDKQLKDIGITRGEIRSLIQDG